MSGPPPIVQLSASVPSGDMVLLMMHMDGKRHEFMLPRHVAAGMVATLAQALAAHTPEPVRTPETTGDQPHILNAYFNYIRKTTPRGPNSDI